MLTPVFLVKESRPGVKVGEEGQWSTCMSAVAMLGQVGWQTYEVRRRRALWQAYTSGNGSKPNLHSYTTIPRNA